jgi:hypothetical protein
VASKPIPLSPELKARGIDARTWKVLTNDQRREVIRQSREIAREFRGKGAPAGTPEAKRRRASKAARAKRLAELPKDKTFEFWHKYGKGDEDAEFWLLYEHFNVA